MNKQKIEQTIRNNPDGFTISLKDYKPYDGRGYSVSFTNLKSKNPLTLIRKIDFIRRMAFSHISDDELYLGGWFNSVDGLFYLDLSFISENIKEIKILMKRFNQISVFNFEDYNAYKLNKGVLIKND